MKTSRLKSLFIASVLMLASSAFVKAQGPPHNKQEKREERREDLETMKIAFITKKLNLSPEEAQQFWPVYNQYTDKLQEMRKKKRMENKEAKKNFDEMSDKDVEQAVDNEIIFRQKELDIQKEYHAKFKAVLPIKKVAKLYNAEEQYKRVLLDRLKDKPSGPGPKPQD